MFPAGSSGGPDGLRPQHLLEMVACQANGASLLSAVSGFVNIVLDGGCPASISPIFFDAKLVRRAGEEIWRRPPISDWINFAALSSEMC